MNILLVTLFSLERNTSVAISNINITKGLLDLGHKVTLVMPHWDKCETEFDFSQVRIIRVPGKDLSRNVGYIRGKLRSHFDILDFTRSYLRNVRKVQIPNEYFDVVISTSDPKTSHVFTTKLLRRVQYGRWIQHWGDPITGDFTRHYWWPEWVIRMYERNIIRKADKAVYVTPFTYEMECKEHPRLCKKITFSPLPAEMLPIVESTDSNDLRLSYLGDYNPSIRNLKPLYDACVALDFVQLTVAGHGPTYPSTKNISFLPRIPQQQVTQIENNSDVLVCICNIEGTMIPGKITYKASTNKHILVAIEDEFYETMKAYFETYNRYIICRNTVESISDALVRIRGMHNVNYTTPERLLPINIVQEILS